MPLPQFLNPPDPAHHHDRAALVQHLGELHPDLFGPGPDTRHGGSSSPLHWPDARDYPLEYLQAVYDASHIGLRFAHPHLD